MDVATVQDQASKVATSAAKLLEEATKLANQTTQLVDAGAAASSMDFLSLFTIFVLACFVGFYVVWSVTPALHSPLMAVT
ncbi:MAG: proton-translocating transhydrogenase family protein, partial [Rhodospirillaceae bacterium]